MEAMLYVISGLSHPLAPSRGWLLHIFLCMCGRIYYLAFYAYLGRELQCLDF